QAEWRGAGALACVGEDTLLLKTGRMAGADIDAENRRARVSAAAKWRDVSALASPRGLAPLSGLSAEVGVVGYTLGGGLGWLSRKHGLACNSVLAAEVITADGLLVRADRSNEPDLFWALRGGGGSFGAVTALEFELYPAGGLCAAMCAVLWQRSSGTRGASGSQVYPTSCARWLGSFSYRGCPTFQSPSAGDSWLSSRPPT